jgi:uncharacterized protein YbjT (DUF2867 family)
MTIAIIGATGNFGSDIIDALLARRSPSARSWCQESTYGAFHEFSALGALGCAR